MFKVLTDENRVRLGEFTTKHGIIKTPVFMNVATQGAIKGALSGDDLKTVGCQVALANTYHLHVRPGDELIAAQGGLHRFMAWDGPILTDSGGFQIFSLSGLRKITDEGVRFNSHVDGRKIFMTPEDSMRIQMNLGSDIIMAFDECIALPATRECAETACERTYRWLVRCAGALGAGGQGSEIRGQRSEIRDQGSGVRGQRSGVGAQGPEVRGQGAGGGESCGCLFGINQGGTFADLRVLHMKRIAELCLPGYAVGGLAVGEETQEMYDTVDAVEEYMPRDKPRYLMGVGTPQNIVECVARGIDFFDCVMPARNGRHGRLYMHDGSSININNEQYKDDSNPIDSRCLCPVCRDGRYSRAYIRHLFRAGEMLAMRLAVLHNLYFYNTLMSRIREAIETRTFEQLRKEIVSGEGGVLTELMEC